MNYKDDQYLLSTNKTFYANNGILGIAQSRGKVVISEGYDGGIDDDEFTPSERKEIAEHAIFLWKKYGGL